MKNCECEGCQCFDCTAYGNCDTCDECAYSDNKSEEVWCNIKTTELDEE